MNIGPDSRVKLSPHVHARNFDKDLVILDLAKGSYFGLDELGAKLWEGLIQGESPATVARKVAGDYDVDVARIETDLVELTHELVVRGLVEAVATSA